MSRQVKINPLPQLTNLKTKAGKPAFGINEMARGLPSGEPEQQSYLLDLRIVGATLSSTPLTNLWLSSAPKVFASSMPSLIATL